MKSISEFIVGKKYHCENVKLPLECVYVGDNTAVLKRHDGNLTFAHVPHLWTEHKELKTVTKYAAVVKILESSETVMYGVLGLSEGELRGLIGNYNKYWELIDIIPVTWTEKDKV